MSNSSIADIVLDESLIKEFFNFYFHKDEGNIDKQIVLFKYLKSFYVTVQQIEPYFEGLEPFLASQLASGSALWKAYSVDENSHSENLFSKEIMEEMLEKSNYKILLVDKNPSFKTKYRCIDINSSSISLAYTQKIPHGRSRTEFQEYLAQLMKNAKKVKIFDNYFQEEDTIESFIDFIERKDIHNTKFTFYLNSQKLTANQKASLKKNNIVFLQYKFREMHDRYIEIDDTLEILLSSGILYVFSEQKELNYTVTLKEKTRIIVP